MPFDTPHHVQTHDGTTAVPRPSSVQLSRERRGALAYQRGLSAEASVRHHYLAAGYRLMAERWRGRAGEVDLIFSTGTDIIFVEVKASKTHAAAAHSLRPEQIARLGRCGEEFVGTLPTGQLTPMRFDVALVDAQGRVETLENALMMC